MLIAVTFAFISFFVSYNISVVLFLSEQLLLSYHLKLNFVSNGLMKNQRVLFLHSYAVV